MTNEELLIVNLAQKKAIGIMANDIGDRLSRGEVIPELMLKLKAAEELTKLFLHEYGQVTPDSSLLARLVFVVQGLLNNYVLDGVHIFDQTQTVPSQPKVVQLNIQGGDSGGTNTIVSNESSMLIISADKLDNDWAYVNTDLRQSPYTLDITGGATLRKNIDYVVFPSGGFQLINGITLNPSDILILRTANNFSVTPSENGNSPVRTETKLTVEGDTTIEWDSVIPGSTQTYAQRHGNSFNFSAFYNDEGVMRNYTPGCSYNLVNGAIQTVNFTEVFPGTITIT